MAPLCTTTASAATAAMNSARHDASIFAIAHLLQHQQQQQNHHHHHHHHHHHKPSSPPPLPLDDDPLHDGMSIDEVAQLVLRKDHLPSASSSAAGAATVSQWRSAAISDDWSFRHDHDDGQHLLLDYQSMDHQTDAVPAAGPSPAAAAAAPPPSSSSLSDCNNIHSFNASLMMQMMRSYSSGDLDMLLLNPASRSGSGISQWIDSLMKTDEEEMMILSVDDDISKLGSAAADNDEESPLPAAEASTTTSSPASEQGTPSTICRYDGGGGGGSGETSAGGVALFFEEEDLGAGAGAGVAMHLMTMNDDVDGDADLHHDCFDSNLMMNVMTSHNHHHRRMNLAQPDKLPELVPYNVKEAAAPPRISDLDKMSLAAAAVDERPPPLQLAPALGQKQSSIAPAAGVGTSFSLATTSDHPPTAQVSPQGVQLMQMLLECAKSVECRNKDRALALLPKLRFQSSRHGDPIQRLTAFFTEALWCRVSRLNSASDAASAGGAPPSLESLDSMTSPYDVSVAFAALNDACPYFTFAHLTANQPIIELLSAALRRQRRRRLSVLRLHIVDFGITHGAQWAALLQAISVENFRQGHLISGMSMSTSSDNQEALPQQRGVAGHGGSSRCSNSSQAAPKMQSIVKVKITGVASPELGGRWKESLAATGRRLEDFGASMGVEVEFAAAPVALGDRCLNASMLRSSSTSVRRKRYSSRVEDEEEEEAESAAEGESVEAEEEEEEEIVVANFMLQLSNVLENGGVERTLAVAAELRPEVATLAEFDADLNEAPWERRFVASLHFFSAMFDSLEASMARDSPHRLCMERSMLGERIVSMVGGAEEGPRRRLQCFSEWQRKMAAAGFTAAPLSSYAAHQARLLLLRFSYCRSFTLTEHLGALSLGWLHKPLLSISSWTTTTF